MEDIISHQLLAQVEEYVDRSWSILKYSPFCIFRFTPHDRSGVIAYLRDKTFQDDIESIRQSFLVNVVELLHDQPILNHELDLIIQDKFNERTPIVQVERVKGMTLLFECVEREVCDSGDLQVAVSALCDWFSRVDIIECIAQWKKHRKPAIIYSNCMAGLV